MSKFIINILIIKKKMTNNPKFIMDELFKTIII